ncbi:MAG: GNAT family N-acetyltransferase [Thermoplasmata archaeon]|nr:GNAT family N-acetyltransferase [Thermoplasmata archaeon]
MIVDDLVDVKGVDLLCWNDLMEKAYGLKRRLLARTDENLLSFIHSDPEGAFVASDDYAGIIGSSFSHVWGTTGWIGPLSVLPSHQSKGLGKELLKRSLLYLEDQGCIDIGLETMPENPTNMGMYLRAGMNPEGLVVIMGKKVDLRELEEEPSGHVNIERLSESAAEGNITEDIRRISRSFRLGLDYSKEIALTKEFGFGDTLIATSRENMVGFAVVQTAPRRISMPMTTVRVLALDPRSKDEFLEPLIISSELLAADASSPEIHIAVPIACRSIAVPIACRRGLDILFSRGYSVVQTFERMMWMGSSGVNDKHYNFCSWTG